MSQTRVFGENPTHDFHANSLAHYLLAYQGTHKKMSLKIYLEPVAPSRRYNVGPTRRRLRTNSYYLLKTFVHYEFIKYLFIVRTTFVHYSHLTDTTITVIITACPITLFAILLTIATVLLARNLWFITALGYSQLLVYHSH